MGTLSAEARWKPATGQSIASAEWQALGTLARVVVTDTGALAEAVTIGRREIEAVDAACSRFRADSELTRLNQAGGACTSISPLLARCLEVALRASRLTDGIVDPTVGEAMLAAGYDRDFSAVSALGPRVTFSSSPGWRVVELDSQSLTVRLPRGVRLDLGATAKAFAADLVVTAIQRQVGSGVLLSLGGDVAVAGQPPVGGWIVRVTDDCRSASDADGQTVAITAGGLATSSTTVRRWSRGGAALHHILDPHTGRPADEIWRTVSVAAATCADANIAATAAIVLGRGAYDWLAARGLPARLVGVDGRLKRTSGWPEARRGLSEAAV